MPFNEAGNLKLVRKEIEHCSILHLKDGEIAYSSTFNFSIIQVSSGICCDMN